MLRVGVPILVGGSALVASAALALGVRLSRLAKTSREGQSSADAQATLVPLCKFPPTATGSVRSLNIMPLIDFYAERPGLHTEPGVSYLVRADNTTILMDLGLNAKRTHPSPLLKNMESLNVTVKEVDMIFLSHPHFDHLGGYSEMKSRTFSLSQGKTDIRRVQVFTPLPLQPSSFNSVDSAVTVVSGPLELRPGIFSMGPMTRWLFAAGKTVEHVLAIRVEGKGIVLLIGCGHPTIEKIVQRAQALFDEPIYAVVGGLHYPVKGGRMNLGPVNLQWLVASTEPPWRGLGIKDVESGIATLAAANPALVALSPHDSSDWSLQRFQEAFGQAFQTVKVGKEICL